MDYYDDLLNVYAYLFQKNKQFTESSARLNVKMEDASRSYQQLNQRADALLADMDQLLSKAYALAKKNNLDVSDLRYQPKSDPETTINQSPVPCQPKVRLPYDFDFQKDFQRLAQEARAAGFTNVHPEQLLTPEEIRHAQEFSQKLDRDFRAATKLQTKDMVILIAAVAVRVLVFFFMRTFQFDSQPQEAQTAEPISSDSMKEPDFLYGGPPEPIPLASTSIQNVDALQGVDLNGILSQISDVPQTDAADVFPSHQEAIPGTLLSPEVIWSRQSFFDFPIAEIQEQDIMANKPILGWLFGVLNILTGTVTTTRLKSFLVDFNVESSMPYAIGQPISTISDVVKPVIQNAAMCKDSIISAVMQEARILGFCKADSQQLFEMFERAQILEQNLTRLEGSVSNILSTCKEELVECIEGIGISASLNTLVSAIHAITYNENDGDLDTFCIRTNRIIVYANAISAMINSTPSLLAEDWASMDYAGFITAIITKIQSDRFWINIKAQFLNSKYMEALEKELDEIDHYFEYCP